MLVADLIRAVEALAPPHLAEPWDNVGLLVGDPSRDLRAGVLLTIDLTEPVLDEALGLGVGAIIAYHPPIFAPLKRLATDSPRGRMLLRLVESRISVYSPHTALDAAPGGLTDWLIDQCLCDDARSGTGHDRRPLIPHPAATDPARPHKIVVFVPAKPPDALTRVRDALATAGAGVIGNYTHCSFTLEGVGSFRAGPGAYPSVGSVGTLEHVDEHRLEMLCPRAALPGVIAALRATHPYEEPAFDVHELAQAASQRPDPTAQVGSGRIATLDAPTPLATVADRLRKQLGISSIQLAGDARSTTRRLAVVPGSGAALIDAALAAGADCFVTGEMKHHEILEASSRGCALLLCGHTETERPYLPVLASKLGAILGACQLNISTSDRAPLHCYF